MRLFDVLPTRTTQRLRLAARMADQSLRKSEEAIDEECGVINDPRTPLMEVATSVISVKAQRTLKWPVALVAGAEELFRKR